MRGWNRCRKGEWERCMSEGGGEERDIGGVRRRRRRILCRTRGAGGGECGCTGLGIWDGGGRMEAWNMGGGETGGGRGRGGGGGGGRDERWGTGVRGWGEREAG